MEKLNWLVVWLWEMIKIQLYCYLYILRGGVVLGVFPAVAAAYACIRQLYIHESYQPLKQSMHKYYKDNFKAANLSGWILSIFSILVYFNWYYVPQVPNAIVKVPLYGVLTTFTLILIICWIYILPSITHFKAGTLEYLYIATIVGLSSLSHTILQFLLLVILYFLAFQFIQISIFIFIPVLALTQMYISLFVFNHSIRNKESKTTS
ncbi:YesL family protein [Gracilibacillus sp. HCP3S3_G5_1]|uniref:YesL family protein n=1 Tax=unclassified Gracilibacillus TaxID=2625209 RepID=UPI003F8A0555